MFCLADAVELLYDVGLHGDAEIFRALHEESLVNQVAQSILLHLCLRSCQLLSGATLALLLCFLGCVGQRFLIVHGGDNVIVDARDDILHHGALDGRRCGSQRRRLRGGLAWGGTFRRRVRRGRRSPLRLRRRWRLRRKRSACTQNGRAEDHPAKFHDDSPSQQIVTLRL